jgi:hypothetical protein
MAPCLGVRGTSVDVWLTLNRFARLAAVCLALSSRKLSWLLDLARQACSARAKFGKDRHDFRMMARERGPVRSNDSENRIEVQRKGPALSLPKMPAQFINRVAASAWESSPARIVEKVFAGDRRNASPR